jgi:hypothetical protein
VGAVACQPGAGDGLVYPDLPKYANPGCRLISSEKSGRLADLDKIRYSGCYQGQVIAATVICLMAPGMSCSDRGASLRRLSQHSERSASGTASVRCQFNRSTQHMH